MAHETSQPAAAQSTGASVSGPRAGFGSRLGALLIDAVIVFTVQFVVGFVIGLAGASSASGTLSPNVQILLGAANIIIALSYFGFLEGSARGQTVGKRVLGIRVIDFNTGQPLGVGRAMVRYVARILSALPLFLGYFWMLWDDQKQTWHDKLISDVVVPESAYPVPASA